MKKLLAIAVVTATLFSLFYVVPMVPKYGTLESYFFYPEISRYTHALNESNECRFAYLKLRDTEGEDPSSADMVTLDTYCEQLYAMAYALKSYVPSYSGRL